MLTYAPIPLRNPFSVLELPSADSIVDQKCPTSIDLVAHVVDDDDLDLSSWSVVNSACSSDNEDDEDEDDGESDEIYADDETSDGTPLDPLTLSSLKSGFTNISKATTARSINSLAASAPENRGHWVLKVGKRKQRREEGKKEEEEEEEGEESLINLKSDRTSTPSLSSDREEDDEEEDEDEAMYMRMTERELSKSARAVRIKNGRVALDHDRGLVKSLGLNLTEVPEWSDKASSAEEKPVLQQQQQQQQQQAQNPKKTLQKMRAPRSKSKSNKNSKKAKIYAEI